MLGAMSAPKLPHWAQFALTLAVAIIAQTMKSQASGELSLPASAVQALALANMLCGVFSQAWRPGGGAGDSRGFAGMRHLSWLSAVGLGALTIRLSAGCASTGAPQPGVVQDVTIGLNAAVCVLTTYSSDMAAGRSEVEAIADAAIKCGLSAVQASGILSAHRRAMIAEGYVVRPASDAGVTP